MAPRLTIFGILSGIHLFGLLIGPIGYPLTSVEFLYPLFFLVYLATVIVLDPLHLIGLPVFVKFETTWPEPTLLGTTLATLIWLCVYLGIAYLLVFATSAIRRAVRPNSAVHRTRASAARAGDCER
jgi:hypothetical protein